jgi:hypothetical protein
MQKQDDKSQLRDDLTDEQKAQALKIGRIEFRSAGATRKRGGARVRNDNQWR